MKRQDIFCLSTSKGTPTGIRGSIYGTSTRLVYSEDLLKGIMTVNPPTGVSNNIMSMGIIGDTPQPGDLVSSTTGETIHTVAVEHNTVRVSYQVLGVTKGYTRWRTI